VPVLTLVLVGALAGYLATRFMQLRTNVPTTIAIGVAGALVGGLALRFLLFVTGWLASLLGAVLGAVLLIWLWKTYVGR
jgi:uncharacterized membrane protein YeaQ/YmgE (transglycosylase-associated protein family)